MYGFNLKTDLLFMLTGMQQFDEILQGRVAFGTKHAAEAFVILLQGTSNTGH
jgi:hypothetical protein